MVSISARQARGPWFDPWWREFSFKFLHSFLISKEKHIAHLKAFKKFASPYFQSPKSFPVPKILSSLQNHSISSKMKLEDSMSKCGKAVFRREIAIKVLEKELNGKLHETLRDHFTVYFPIIWIHH